MYQIDQFGCNDKSVITWLLAKSDATIEKSTLELVLVHIFSLSIEAELIILQLIRAVHAQKIGPHRKNNMRTH